MTPEVIADSTVSLAAAIGLGLVIPGMQTGDPLSRRFRAALGGLATLMLVRTLGWVTGRPLFDSLTTLIAGLVPLFGLIVTEAMMRRHAPPILKWMVALGAAGFAVAAFLPASLAEPARTYILLGFQVTSLAAVGLLALTRDTASLSQDENRAIDRMLLSLLLILPLIASDFHTPLLYSPVRLGGIAILGLAWLSLGLGHSAGSGRGVILGFAGLILVAGFATLAIIGLADLPARVAVQAGAVVLSALLVYAIARETHSLRHQARADTVLRHLA
jgi:hypothetical protein